MATAGREAKTSNITFRLTPDEKALLEEGAILAGAPDVTTFVLGPALDRARELTQRELATVLTEESRRVFIMLMEQAPAPSARLMRNLRDERHEINRRSRRDSQATIARCYACRELLHDTVLPKLAAKEPRFIWTLFRVQGCGFSRLVN